DCSRMSMMRCAASPPPRWRTNSLGRPLMPRPSYMKRTCASRVRRPSPARVISSVQRLRPCAASLLIRRARNAPKSAAEALSALTFQSLIEQSYPVVPDPDTLLTVDETLAKLAAEDPTAPEIAGRRWFAGLSIDEAADPLGVSRAAAFRDWAYARAVLTIALADDENPPKL